MSVAGCSIAGEWRVVAVDPQGNADARLPSCITFDGEGRYAATQSSSSGVVTIIGRYQWDGGTLTLEPRDGDRQRWPCQRDWNDTLYIRYPAAQRTYRLTLRRSVQP